MLCSDTAAKLEGLSVEIVRRAEEKLQPHLHQTLSTFSADRTVGSGNPTPFLTGVWVLPSVSASLCLAYKLW
jgi:hypothetical protein